MKKEIERNEKGFASFTLVAGSHDHQKIRIWVNNTLVKREITGTDYVRVGEIVCFPFQAARITQTEKGSLVMRSTEGWTVHLIEEKSGYRGSCSIDQLFPPEAEIVASGKTFHSPQGNLGETAWVLVNAQSPIRVIGRRTGRRVDKEGIDYTLHPDGRVEEAEEEGLATELA